MSQSNIYYTVPTRPTAGCIRKQWKGRRGIVSAESTFVSRRASSRLKSSWGQPQTFDLLTLDYWKKAREDKSYPRLGEVQYIPSTGQLEMVALDREDIPALRDLVDGWLAQSPEGLIKFGLFWKRADPWAFFGRAIFLLPFQHCCARRYLTLLNII